MVSESKSFFTGLLVSTHLLRSACGDLLAHQRPRAIQLGVHRLQLSLQEQTWPTCRLLLGPTKTWENSGNLNRLHYVTLSSANFCIFLVLFFSKFEMQRPSTDATLPVWGVMQRRRSRSQLRRFRGIWQSFAGWLVWGIEWTYQWPLVKWHERFDHFGLPKLQEYLTGFKINKETLALFFFFFSIAHGSLELLTVSSHSWLMWTGVFSAFYRRISVIESLSLRKPEPNNCHGGCQQTASKKGDERSAKEHKRASWRDLI